MSIDNIVGYQITRVSLLSLANFEKAVGQPFKLGKVEYTILQLVREGQCKTLSQLAKELQMSAPSASVWLDKLTARRLLSRSKSDTDGRAQQLQLTDSGLRLIEQAHEALLKSEQNMLAVLSPGERTILLEILHKLARSAASPQLIKTSSASPADGMDSHRMQQPEAGLPQSAAACGQSPYAGCDAC